MNVLITRPDERGQQLLDKLAEKQIFAMHQPLFRLEPGQERLQLPAALNGLTAGDYVFFVSKHAVDFAHQTLKETGFRWRDDLHYFAVGQYSAQYAASQLEQAVRYPLSSENSEGVLALPEMQQVAGKNVLILRAQSGREYFAQQMIARQAQVSTLACYQRVVLSENMPEKLSLAKRMGIDTIIVSSLAGLNVLFAHTAEAERDWLLGCRLIVVSQRLADNAIKLGWQADKMIISDKADNASLQQIILQHRES